MASYSSETSDLVRRADRAHKNLALLSDAANHIMIGQEEVTRLVLAAFLARGHVLMTGGTGLGKTTLLKNVSKTISADFQRIQFTQDLTPMDILGLEIYNEEKGDFQLQEGPIFSNIVLGDEINRASPRTQSATLQAMEEREVTIGKETLKLGPLFHFVATRNPGDHEGVNPLPEAQLDRFMIDVKITNPSAENEKDIIFSMIKGSKTSIEPVMTMDQFIEYQKLLDEVTAKSNEKFVENAISITRKLRPTDPMATYDVKQNIRSTNDGVRAAFSLIRMSHALAMFEGNLKPETSHLRRLTQPVLGHRVNRHFSADQNVEQIIDRVTDEVLAL